MKILVKQKNMKHILKNMQKATVLKDMKEYCVMNVL